MKLYKILIPISLILSISIAISVSPYVSISPPRGQYHPFSEIWINESTIDWLGVSHVGLGNLLPSQNVTYDIGNENLWFRKAYIKTLYVEDIIGGTGTGEGNLSGSGKKDYIAKWIDSSTLAPSVLKDTGNSLWTNVPFKIEEGISYPYSNPSSLIVASGKGDAITGYTTVSGKSAIYGIAGSPDSWAGYFEGGKGLYASNIKVGNKLETPNLYASIFRDKDDTNFYVDPAGGSKVKDLEVTGTLKASKLTDKDNTGYYVDPASTSKLKNINAENVNANNIEAFNIKTGNLVPSQNVTYDIGNENLWFRKAYIKTLYVEDIIGGIETGEGGSSVCECTNLYASTLYASIFKDKDDTDYYVDPSGTSKLKNVDIKGSLEISNLYASIFRDKDNTNYYVNPSSGSKIWGLEVEYTLKAPRLTDINDGNYYVDPSYWSKLKNVEVTGTLKAPKLVDKDNTGYYVDPAGTSKLKNINAEKIETSELDLSTLYASIFRDKDDTNFYVDPAGGSKVKDLEVTGTLKASKLTDKDNTGYYVDPASTSKLFNLEVDNTLKARIFQDIDDTNYYVDPSYWSKLKNVEVTGTLKAPKLVDKDNTNYYIDPYGTSALRNLEVYNITDLYDKSYYLDLNWMSRLYSLEIASDLEVGNNLIVKGTLKAPKLVDKDNTDYYVDPASTSKLNEIHAKIIKDLDNTGYYVDPAGTSKLYRLYVSIIYDLDNSDCYINPSYWSKLRYLKADWGVYTNYIYDKNGKIRIWFDTYDNNVIIYVG